MSVDLCEHCEGASSGTAYVGARSVIISGPGCEIPMERYQNCF